MAWGNIRDYLAEYFGMKVYPDFYTVILIVFFGFLFYLGYFLMDKQIRLVKAEDFGAIDRIKCIIYGFIFASTAIIIIAVMLLFGLNTPQLKSRIIPPPGDFSPIVLWPIGYLTVFLLIFPLIDFVYIASSPQNKGLTFFEEFLAEKILHRFGSKSVSYVFAVLLWFGIFILPPYLFTMLLGIPPVFTFVSWALLVPLVILTYFGARGFIAGLVTAYYYIPAMGRSLFLNFDRKGKRRQFREFLDFPIGYIGFYVQVFVYIFMFYSFTRTVIRLFDVNNPVKMQYFEWSVFITLFFGLTGYFTRFWQRKIKFRWIDVLLSAWLIATTGLNVMINFLMTNSGTLTWTFLHWSFTEPITYRNFLPQGDYLLFVPAAVIEETVMIVLITVYVFKLAGTDFLDKSKLSVINRAANFFTVIPLFNLIRVKEKEIRDAAYRELINVYSRIPYRKNMGISDRVFADPLFTALTDDNYYAYHAARYIISYYLEKHPDDIIPLINRALSDGNRLKKRRTALILTEHPGVAGRIDKSIVFKLLRDPDYTVRRAAISIVNSGKMVLPKEITKRLLNDPDFTVRAGIMRLIADVPENAGNFGAILSSLNHKSPEIRAAAARCVSLLGTFTAEGDLSAAVSDPSVIPNIMDSLMDMLTSSNWGLKTAALNALAKIGNVRGYKVPFEPIFAALIDNNKNVRSAAVPVVINYLMEQAFEEIKDFGNKISAYGFDRNRLGFDPSKKIKKSMIPKRFRKIKDRTSVKERYDFLLSYIFDKSPSERIILTILEVIAETWPINHQKCIKAVVSLLKHPDPDVKEKAGKIAAEIGKYMPEVILNAVLPMEDEVTYLKKGVIAELIISICKNHPDLTSVLLEKLIEGNDTEKTNAANALDVIAEEYPQYVDIDKIFNVYFASKSAGLKKKLIKIINVMAEKKPEKFGDYYAKIREMAEEEDNSVRLAAIRMIYNISDKFYDKIDLKFIETLLSDKDPFIREMALKIIARVAKPRGEVEGALPLFIKHLSDKDWSVRNTALEGLLSLGIKADSKGVVDRIILLLSDKEKWTRIKALEILSEIAARNPDIVDLDAVKPLLSDKDPEIRIGVAKVLGAYRRPEKVLPLLMKLMADPDPKVRENAVSAFVKATSSMSVNDLYAATLRYFSDETDILLQQSLALALKRILRYESINLKKRLIDILKIRCQNSQDPILCQVLQDLME